MSWNRRKQAPWNFECPYKDSCPHLEGLSTHWVFHEYQSDEHLDHWKVRDVQNEELEKALDHIVKLEKDNEDLKAKLKAIHRRQFKSNKKTYVDSSKDKPPEKKKRGAPKGHPGWHRRKPDHVLKR